MADSSEDPSGEIPFLAPLPLHERQWRHPSEVGQMAPAPSLGRTTVRKVAMLVASTSVVLSLVLIALVLPSRPEPSSPMTAEARSASATTIVRNRAVSRELNKFGVLQTTGQLVVALSQTGFLLTSRLDATPGQSVTIIPATSDNVIRVHALVVETDEDLDITWLHVSDPESGAYLPLSSPLRIPRSINTEPRQGKTLWIATAHDRVGRVKIGIAGNASILVPLDPKSRTIPRGNGVALDAEGRFVGWCIERSGTHWMVPLNVLERHLLRLEANVEQP
jgi:hypothetical protein